MEKVTGLEITAPLFLITKSLESLKKFLKQQQHPNLSFEKCLYELLYNGKHFYTDGLDFVDKNDELKIANSICRLIQHFNVENVDVGVVSLFPQPDNLSLKSYILELKRECDLYNGFQKISLLVPPEKLVPDCGVLSHLSAYLSSGQFNYDVVRNLLKLNIKSNEAIFETTNAQIQHARNELLLIDQLMVVKWFLDSVLTSNANIEENVNRMRAIFKTIKDLRVFNALMQLLFQLIFVQSEDFRKQETISGFLCHQRGVEKILNFMKIVLQQKSHSKEFVAAEEACREQFNQQLEHVKNALWLLALLERKPKTETEQSLYTPILKSSSLFTPIKPPQSSSDDDEKVTNTTKKYSSYPRKKAPKKKVHTKSDGSGTGTAPQCGSSSFPNYEDDQIMQQGGTVVAKMLASADTLMAVCLHNNDLVNVQAVIKKYKLENSMLEKNFAFIGKFAATKETLKTIIDKLEQEKRQPTPESMISQITKVTVLGFEASKVINKLETFIMTNTMLHDEATRLLIEKHKSSYNLLGEEKLANILDMMLSLSCSHDLNLNLKQLCNKYMATSSTIEKIGYQPFLENVMNALSSYRIAKGRDYSIDEILTREFYKLDSQTLPQKLEVVHSIEQFLINEKTNYAMTTHSKCNQRLVPMKLLNRVQVYVKNVEEVLKFVPKIEADSKSKILQLNLEMILGQLMFNGDQHPNVVESYAKSVHLNFIHVLTVNCLPKIYIHHPAAVESDRKILNKFYNALEDDNPTFEEELPAFTLTSAHQNLLNYVHTSNEVIAYLLGKIFDVSVQSELPKINRNPIFENLMVTQRVENLISCGLYESKALAAISFDRISVVKICQKFSSNPTAVIKVLNNITEVQYRTNVEILDNIKDSCYLKIIFNPEQGADKYDYISMITDHNVRADTVLKCLVKIKSVELAEQLIKELLLTLAAYRPAPSSKYSEYREKLQTWYDNIVIYKSIAKSIDNYNWIDVMETSHANPEKILEHLLRRKLYDLCLNWTEIHPLKDLKHRHPDITGKFSTALLDNHDINETCDPVLIQIIESSLSHQRIVEFYDGMIVTGDWKNLQLLHYFLKYASAKHMVKVCPKKIQRYRFALAIFEIVGSQEYTGLWKLIGKPLLIIEQYLMNSKFVILQRVFDRVQSILDKRLHQICQFCKTDLKERHFNAETTTASLFISNHRDTFVTTACIDALIRIYAAIALDFRVADKPSSEGNSAVPTEMSSLDSLCDEFVLPKTVPTKAKWVEDGAVTHCMSCKRVTFTMLIRRHHCRRCGRVVCHSCSLSRLKIPEMYSDIPVRCCDDCFRATEELAHKKSRSPRVIAENVFENRLPSAAEPDEDEWILSGNTKHDHLLRDEFSYEYAPSVSLCLSICAFHSQMNNVECVDFLLHYCRKLQALLGPIQPGQLNPEVDYVLVTRMLNCLILAAKVRGGEPTECNNVIDYGEIISLVVRNGCQHFLQLDPMDSSALRRLCDSLVRADKWSLALDLSLKCGFQVNGIMASWGVSCLKAGCYSTAREKLAYCMPKIEDNTCKNLTNQLEMPLNISSLMDVVGTKRPLKSPPLLVEVLKVLESNRCDQQKPELLQRANSIASSNQALAIQKLKAKANVPLNEPALRILNTITNLKQITNGIYTSDLKVVSSTDSPLLAASRDYLPQISITKTRYYEECMFYLLNYGSHADIVGFMIQNKLIVYALKYILLQKVDPATFIHVIFMPHVKHGKMSTIIELMTEIDQTMLIWKDFITQCCRYLEVNRLLNTLYQLQNLLQDPIRASMTSVKFYSMQCSTFLDLQTNTHHLLNAKKHLQSELELCNWEEIKMTDSTSSSSDGRGGARDNSLSMKMDLKTLNGHINTINRQIEIVKFLAACEQKNGADAMQVLSKIFVEISHLPTLFGKVNEKIQLAVLTLVCGKNVEEGFGLSFRIIQDFNLNSVKIYGLTAKYLASNNQISEVEKLISCIRSNVDKEPVTKTCDEITCLAVKTVIDCYGGKIKPSVDNLIKSVTDTETKIQCYIWSGQLKSAYLLAVQHNRLNDVKKILRQAEKLNQPHIKRLCEKKLNLNV